MKNLGTPKTPISYYGGKQRMVKYILPLIQAANCETYIEPFCGGAAVFFAKPEHKCEVLNDLNGEVANFYKVLKTDFDALKYEINTALYSRKTYKQCMVIYENPELFTEVKRAFAFYILTQQGFSSKIGSWGVERNGDKSVMAFANRKEAFTDYYCKRLEHCQVENTDAVELIKKRDETNVLFYCDPPYVGTACGHYEGYKTADYIQLLDALSKIKGRFILSSYPNENLDLYVDEYGWKVTKVEQSLNVTGKRKQSKTKTEAVITNF